MSLTARHVWLLVLLLLVSVVIFGLLAATSTPPPCPARDCFHGQVVFSDDSAQFPTPESPFLTPHP